MDTTKTIVWTARLTGDAGLSIEVADESPDAVTEAWLDNDLGQIVGIRWVTETLEPEADALVAAALTSYSTRIERTLRIHGPAGYQPAGYVGPLDRLRVEIADAFAKTWSTARVAAHAA